MDYSKARINMVDGQIHTAGVTSEEILDAFLNMPRELFLPEKMKGIAYTDEDIPSCPGRILLEPMVHAKLLQAAQPTSTDIALDIAGGTGYSAAILSPLVSTVIALESNQKMLDKAAKNWDELLACNVVGMVGDLKDGAPEQGPFSLISINGAVEDIPQTLIDQLAPQGRLITILKSSPNKCGEAVLVKKDNDGNTTIVRLFETNGTMIPDFKKAPAFVF